MGNISEIVKLFTHIRTYLMVQSNSKAAALGIICYVLDCVDETAALEIITELQQLLEKE